MAGVKGRSGTNRNKEKPFADALRMEIAAMGEDHQGLRKIARNLIRIAQGDKDALPAIREIADRMDGKVPQTIAGDDDAPLLIERVERVIVNAANSDG